jgi:hypothetical protein
MFAARATGHRGSTPAQADKNQPGVVYCSAHGKTGGRRRLTVNVPQPTTTIRGSSIAQCIPLVEASDG